MICLFAKEPYERDYILQKRHKFFRWSAFENLFLSTYLTSNPKPYTFSVRVPPRYIYTLRCIAFQHLHEMRQLTPP